MDPSGIDQHLRAELPRILGEAPATPIGREDLALRTRYAGARTPTETALISIWEEELAVNGIGIDDEFFALGGDSFAAAAVFAGIADILGVELSISILARHGTIRELAVAIENWCATHPVSPLVTIRVAGSAAPIVVLHGTGGEIHFLRKLRDALDPARALHGLRGRGIVAGETPVGSVAAMAADHLTTLRGAHVASPMALIGSCDGAMVAYEMAQQLTAAGTPPETLVLIDPPRDAAAQAMPDLRVAGANLGLRFRLMRRRARRLMLAPKPHHISRDFIETLTLALSSYRIRPYGGRLLLIVAADRAAGDLAANAWPRLARGPFEHAIAAADHASLVNGDPPPYAPIVARHLTALRGA